MCIDNDEATRKIADAISDVLLTHIDKGFPIADATAGVLIAAGKLIGQLSLNSKVSKQILIDKSIKLFLSSYHYTRNEEGDIFVKTIMVHDGGKKDADK